MTVKIPLRSPRFRFRVVVAESGHDRELVASCIFRNRVRLSPAAQMYLAELSRL